MLVAAAPARAARSATPSRQSTFETIAVLEPAPNATLRGGETAVLRWEWLKAFPAELHADEWEAFLSFDGGRTFPQRITPHVDIDRRAVVWQVPNVPTSEARVLLRFGDEHEEHALLLPVAFRIVRGATPVWTPRRFHAGEPVQAGAAGVVAWSEGDRTGRSSRAVEAAPLEAGLAGAHAPRIQADPHDLVCERGGGAANLPPPAAARPVPVPPAAPRLATPIAPPAVGDILLLIQRRNE